MKRVLTFASTGLFVTGLALLPLSARADQVTTAPTATSGTATTGSSMPVKKDEKKVTVTPGSAVPAPSTTPAKTPAKGS